LRWGGGGGAGQLMGFDVLLDMCNNSSHCV